MRALGKGYLRKRAMELASPATRALTDPLAEWARLKIRLDGRPFNFDGHEYQQASLLCAGGSEHERRVVNPTRENEHLWRLELPFGED